MCQSASISSAQQASQQLKIGATVAKKAQDAASVQGNAVVKLLAEVARSVKTPGVGEQFDGAA